MSTAYSLNIKNESTQCGNFCIFQEVPDVNIPNIVTLAWLSKTAHPTTQVTFDWKLAYSFFWSTHTNLSAGAKVTAAQSWRANLDTINKVTFDRINNAYTFTNQTQGAYNGNLYIEQTGQVQANDASVGVAMSGKGAFALMSQPNMRIIMTPKPTYYVVFGNFTEGEIIDIGEVAESAYKVQFKGTTSKSLNFTASNVFEEAK